MTGASGIAKTVQEKRRLLRSHFLLRNLSQFDLERIAAAATCARFGRHEKIFRRGESETNLIIMVSGRVKLSATSTDGQELLANIVERGHVFGEIAVIDGKPRSYDATALEANELLRQAQGLDTFPGRAARHMPAFHGNTLRTPAPKRGPDPGCRFSQCGSSACATTSSVGRDLRPQRW